VSGPLPGGVRGSGERRPDRLRSRPRPRNCPRYLRRPRHGEVPLRGIPPPRGRPPHRRRGPRASHHDHHAGTPEGSGVLHPLPPHRGAPTNAQGLGIESVADLKNKTVCASQDFSPGMVAHHLHPKRILQTRTWTDCLMAMQQGQVDAIYSDDAILSGLAAQDPDTHLIGASLGEGYYGVAMAPPGKVVGPGAESLDEDDEHVRWQSEGLTRQVNRTLERLRDTGELDRMYKHWLEQYLGPARELPAHYRTPEESATLTKEREEYNREQVPGIEEEKGGE